jgi:phospholipase/carboxylesterase
LAQASLVPRCRRQGLAALGVPVEWHIAQGVGHGIDPEGLRHGGEFLARRLAAAA